MTNHASQASGIDGNQADNSAGGSGAAYVFTRSGSTWSQQAYIKSRNTPAKVETCSRLDISGTAVFPCTPQHFGFSVALSADGNLLAVGAPEEGANFTPGSAAGTPERGILPMPVVESPTPRRRPRTVAALVAGAAIVALALAPEADESEPIFYLVRLVAYGLIIAVLMLVVSATTWAIASSSGSWHTAQGCTVS